MMRDETRKVALKRWGELASELPLLALLCSCSVYPFIAAMDLRQSFWVVLGVSAACVTVCSAALYGRRSAMLSGLALAMFAAVSAAILLLSGDEGPAAAARQGIESFIGWAASYLLGHRVERPQYARLLAMIFNALVCSAVCLSAIRKARPQNVLLPGLAVFVALFTIGHDIHLPSLFGFISAAALYCYYSRYKNAGTNGSATPVRKHALFLLSAMPAALAVLCAAMILSGALPIDPLWMKELRERQKQQNNTVVDYLISENKTIVSTTELGGVPLLDDTVLMEVTSRSGDVYLRGASRDTYTGHSWIQSAAAPSIFVADDCNLCDTVETADAFGLWQLPIDDIFPNQSISIRYKGMHTNILYLPLKALSVTGLGEGATTSLIGKDAVMFDTAAPPSLEYNVEYYRPDRESPAFLDLANQCHKGFYEENRYSLSGHTLAMPDSAMNIYTTYLQLPESIPQRVWNLALEITGGIPTDYGKAEAVERYLSANYAYTLAPGRFNRTADFVDQFLFETKEGYCTYFATAMAVLLRCAGVPSRYVEGFVLPPAHAGSDLHLVTRRQGHAWVEAYFEGLGWITFEPTSSYAGGARPSVTPQPSRQAAPSVTPNETSPPLPGRNDSSEAATSAVRSGLLLPLCLITFTLLLAAAYAVPYAAGRRMLKANPRDAALVSFKQCLDVLAALGVRLENGESLEHLAQRAENAAGLPAHGLLKAVEVFQIARFSSHDVTIVQKKLLLAVRNDLMKASAKKIGPVRYLFFKWMWG